MKIILIAGTVAYIYPLLVNAMKLYTLILLLLIAQAGYSQVGTDIISKKLDSLKTAHYKLKDRARRMEYENKVCASLYAVDSVVYGKDSVTISFWSQRGKLLKKHRKQYDGGDGSIIYEKVEYCNGMELPEFMEQWEQARSTDEESGNSFRWTIYSYERYEYDTAGRIVALIKFYPAISRSRALRFNYMYSADGKPERIKTYIELEQFWD